MNNKITFPRLSTMLADRSGRSKRFSEDFLREFFALISETLEAQESVKVKGLGTFRLTRVEPRRSVDVTTGEPMEISGHTKVVFIPSKELAEAVNAPFEAFSAIEIGDNVDISKLFTPEEITLQDEEEGNYAEKGTNDSDENLLALGNEKSEEPKTQAEATMAPEDIANSSTDTANPKDSDYPAKEKESVGEEPDKQENLEEEDTILEESCSEKTDEEPETEIPEELVTLEEEDHIRKVGWLKALLISVCAIIVALFATLAVWYYFATDDFNAFFNKYGLTASARRGDNRNADQIGNAPSSTAIQPAPAMDSIADSIRESEKEEDVPTAPSDAVVYDTISTTRYLTTMAKAHYGNYNLWPYIYQENQSFLGHPDRIRPGTPVAIPKLSKYGVDPNNNADIEKAKKLGIEIYARYGKKI